MIAHRSERTGLLAARPVLVVGSTPAHESTVYEYVQLYSEGAYPPAGSWLVGERASQLYADLHERPRRITVCVGAYAQEVLRYWWNETSLCTFVETLELSPVDFVNALPRVPRKVPLAVRSRWLTEIIARFNPDRWPKSCVDWPWVDPPGRPQALLRGNSVPAAHVSLEAFEGPRPSIRHQALHSCDRGQHCVNGAHLRWGLEIENRLDQSARARGDIGKIGLEKAREVRKELDELSERHGVPLDAIARIAGGKSWTDESWETTEHG